MRQSTALARWVRVTAAAAAITLGAILPATTNAAENVIGTQSQNEGSQSVQRTMNRGLHAPPVKAPVVIDGKLDEWDLSGGIVSCKDVGTLLDVESCRTAAMWDEQGLYLAFRFRDPTPIVNHIDPVTMAGNGWRSDCVQLRLNMAGFVSHVDAWYYTDGKKPGMTIQYGRLGVKDGGQPKVERPKYPEELGARQAFLMDEDRAGYTQEMFIPWAVVTLDGKQPPPEADLRVGLELFWGDITGQGWPRSRMVDNLSDDAKTVDFFWTSIDNWGKLIREKSNDLKLPPPAWQAAVKPEPQGAAAITFTLPKESYVTLALEDAAGNRVRSLLGGVKLKAGENTIRWDGLDDRNGLLPAGDYRWVGLYRDAIDIHWLMSFYQPNPHTPWNTADGTGAWGSDHGCMVAAAAGEGLVFLAGLGAEAGNGLFASNEQGEKQWNVRDAGADLLAYADGILYAYRAASSWNPLGLADTGVMRFEAKTGKWLDIQGPDGTPVKRLSLLSPEESKVEETKLPGPAGNQKTRVISGFAANAAGLYLSVPGKNVVRAFDSKTFQLQREYAVAGAGTLFAPNAASLLVATPAGLQHLNLADGKLAVLAAGDFAKATAITANKESIWVSFGAPTPQVRVFSTTGKPERTIGKAEGCTRNGFYDPNDGFYNPSGLAADSQGRLWVAEDNMLPKRTSVWKDGAWQRDFIGDTYYGGGGLINPLDPTMAFYNGMRFKIDLDKGTSQLVEVGLVMPEGGAQHGIAAGRADVGETEYLNAYQGRAYLHFCRNPARQIYRQRADGRWALCVHIDPAKKLAWMDLNDDDKVQDNEVVRGGEKDDWGGTDYWGNRPSQNLDLSFERGKICVVDEPGMRLRVQRVTAGGTPVYDFTKFEPMAGECQNGIGLKDGSYNSGCAAERGEYFSEMRKIYPVGTERRTFWFRGLNTGRWTPRLPAPGVVLYPFQAHGVADAPAACGGELVCWVSDFGQRYLFTDDMLYVGQLFKDGRLPFEDWPANPKRGFLANDMAPGQESFHGFFTRLNDGRYILTSGFTDCRVFELKGIDSLRRLPGGTVTLGAEQLARAAEIRAFRQSGGRERGRMAVAAAKAVTVDGQLGDWNREASAARIAVDADRGADVMTAADEANLYVAWEVRKPTPLRNQADRWQLAFGGGDAVDLMYRASANVAGAAPGADTLDAPGVRAGDLRLVITELGGELKAVLYRPVSDAKAPYLFDAFEGAGRANAVRMDEVRLAPEVKAALTRAGQGYIVEAAIPWTLLGGKPAVGAEFRVDFGVMFGGETAGRKVERRAYWENRDTQITADIPSEAALQPGNWGVGVVK